MTTTTPTKRTYPYRLFYSADRGIEWRRQAFMSAHARDTQAQRLRENGYTVEAYDVLPLPLDEPAHTCRYCDHVNATRGASA